MRIYTINARIVPPALFPSLKGSLYSIQSNIDDHIQGHNFTLKHALIPKLSKKKKKKILIKDSFKTNVKFKVFTNLHLEVLSVS